MKKLYDIDLRPIHPGAKIFKDDPRPQAHGLLSSEGHMGREDAVFRVKERLPSGKGRLYIKNVDTGSGDNSRVQGLRQIRRNHDWAARQIEEHRRGFHQRQGLFVD